MQLFGHNYHGGNNTQSSVRTTPDDNINSGRGKLVALSSPLPRGTSSIADMTAAYAQYCGHAATQFRQGAQEKIKKFYVFTRNTRLNHVWLPCKLKTQRFNAQAVAKKTIAIQISKADPLVKLFRVPLLVTLHVSSPTNPQNQK